MNLKEASRRLGVHYQTAYKWVRSGSLTAIRVGSRYEVSQSAIDQFVANRRSVLMEAEPVPTPARRITDLDFEDVLEEFEVMASDPLMTLQSVSAFAARRGAEVLGDLCLVVVAAEDGIHAKRAVVDHPIPAKAAFVTALLATAGPRAHIAPNLASEAFTQGNPVLIPHLSQDQLRASVRPDLRQYVSEYPLYSLLSAPIVSDGRPAGFVAFSRDTADRPYGAEDQDFAVSLGKRIGPLLTATCEITRSWQLRNSLVTLIRDRIAGMEPDHVPTADELGAWIGREQCVASDLPVAVFSPDGIALYVNEAANRQFSPRPEGLVGQPFDSRTIPEDSSREHADFAKLMSGELDYLDTHSVKQRGDGTPTTVVTHRAAVRHPSATLACIVSVARPLRHHLN